jgi:hypothetical protein
MKYLTIILITVSFAFNITLSQKKKHGEEEHEGKNRIGFVAEATFVPEGTSDEHCEECEGESKGIVVPTIGLEYTRALSHHWEVGFSAELELDHYLILDKELERENALILVAFFAYRIVHNWFFFGGAGMEYEKHKSLGVFRFGTSYEILLGKGWDITPAFTFDHKIDLNSFALGFSVGKRF